LDSLSNRFFLLNLEQHLLGFFAMPKG